MSTSGIANALSMIEGHHRFLNRNTGDTNNSQTDFYVVNNQGVLANNRHFIANSRMEAQPNGDATTEGQSLQIIGYAYAYLATGKSEYLDKAIYFFDAYVDYFYKGQPIPETPQRWICNWIVNGKEPVLANYPVDSDYPTHSGFKGSEFTYVNGLTVIPHGSPHWGQYLDLATFAFEGALAWDAVNASVKGINPDGSTNWDTDGEQYDVDWIITWEGHKVDSDGNVISSNHPESEKGSIQLKDTSLNGTYKTNYATKQPVEYGGYLIGRNEVQHNRPCHVPLLGDVTQLGNAADAEEWFLDACYLLWKITGKDRFKKAFDSVRYTLQEYTLIDAQDMFFRRSEYATTPHTDGISYSFTYPSGLESVYSRDSEGYINIQLPDSAQESLEQQSIWFRINQLTNVLTEFGGIGNTGSPVRASIQLLISLTKDEADGMWWGTSLQDSTSLSPVSKTFGINSLARLEKPEGGDYIIADPRSIIEYGDCALTFPLEDFVLDNRSAVIAKAVFPTDDAGLTFGFWLLQDEQAPLTNVVIRTDAEFDIRIVDDNNWRWYWIVPNTNNIWQNLTLDPNNLILSGYQPDQPEGAIEPLVPVFTQLAQFDVILENSSDINKTFSLYCVDDIPPTYSLEDGYTLKYRITLSCDEAFTAKVGDCTLLNVRDDPLAYTPGVIPFSNIYMSGAMQFDGWHGMPYPGYQYPMIFCTGDLSIPSESTRLSNMVDFLYDSQQWYNNQFGVLGPVASAYIWNRWDNFKYGTPDTWTMYHWGTDEAWSGYQPRAFMGACRAWHELVIQGHAVPYKLQAYCENWINFIIDFQENHEGQTPTYFPPDGPPEVLPNDFTGHMAGLFLSGACHAYMAGCTIAGLPRCIETILVEIQKNYPVNQGSDSIMNGGWSLWVSGGMFFGFWSGELLRALSAYIMYQTIPPGESIYRNPRSVIDE